MMDRSTPGNDRVIRIALCQYNFPVGDIDGNFERIRSTLAEARHLGVDLALFPELKVFRNDEPVADRLYETDPDRCCDILKVLPTRRAIEEMNVMMAEVLHKPKSSGGTHP